MEHNAYISLDTGKIWRTSHSSDAFDEELSDNLETSDRYVAIPHKNEFDLGGHRALRFVARRVVTRALDGLLELGHRIASNVKARFRCRSTG
ncbi:hypothetical protein [Paraburkholderia atlantica]|uniref:hypothetical protein n=1 Tax=Paraburkholderia atlantica TaxID=2654982 RepID=UPI0020CAE80E|nr:hypothetical protein [Paraburkholderia atlantica]